MDLNLKIEDWADFTSELLTNSCDVIIAYEAYLKNTEDVKKAVSLARSMHILKNSIPKELLEAVKNEFI